MPRTTVVGTISRTVAVAGSILLTWPYFLLVDPFKGVAERMKEEIKLNPDMVRTCETHEFEEVSHESADFGNDAKRQFERVHPATQAAHLVETWNRENCPATAQPA